jgi:hypothetical protein
MPHLWGHCVIGFTANDYEKGPLNRKGGGGAGAERDRLVTF